MRILALLALGTLGLGLLSGCTTASGATAGTVAGGLLGAGIGAIAGDPVAGALIGSGVGLGGGALIGHENERIRAQQGYVYDDAFGTSGHYVYPTAYAPPSPPPPPPPRVIRERHTYYAPPPCPPPVIRQEHHYWDHGYVRGY